MNPRVLRRIHGTATAMWAVLAVPTVLLWRQSIPWLSFMSVWALVSSHFSAWQASRTEVKQDEEASDG